MSLDRKSHGVGCPQCRSSFISKSRKRGLKDFFLHALLSTRPYRCMDCDHRFFRFHMHLLHASQRASTKPTS